MRRFLHRGYAVYSLLFCIVMQLEMHTEMKNGRVVVRVSYRAREGTQPQEAALDVHTAEGHAAHAALSFSVT